MSSKDLLFLVSYFIYFFSLGQNLVQNPSFETYSSCPSGWAEIANASGWSSFSESCDYYNACGSSGFNVPVNSVGNQPAHSGNSYCGVISYAKPGLYREAVGSQLLVPLASGQKYFFSMYASLAMSSPIFVFASNKIGVKFTMNAYATGSNQIPIGNFAQVYSDSIIKDTSNWTLISGSFIADSNYRYISVGNFFDDMNTDTSSLVHAPNGLYAYYYIDDICVSTDSLYAATWTGIRDDAYSGAEIKIYPNPVDKQLIIEQLPENFIYIELFDAKGITYKKETLYNSKKIIDISGLEPGVYYVRVQTKDSGVIQKIMVRH